MKTHPNYSEELLGRFHHDIEISKNLRSSELSPPYHPSGNRPKHTYVAEIFKAIYGENLKNKSMLSVACNAGAQLFECQKIGILKGYGFDVRDLWINQANWLKQNITSYSTNNLEFKQHGLDALTFNEIYDVSFFDGILYHLADPFLHLSNVAKITKDIITVNTMYDCSTDSIKPALIFKREGKTYQEGLTGVEGVSWAPNGEKVIELLLRELGFIEFKLISKTEGTNGTGRLCLYGTKIKGLLHPIKN